MTYAADDLGRLSTITETRGGVSTLLATYGYDPLSRRTSLSYGTSGATIAYEYEPDSDLDRLVHQFNGSSVTFDYGHNRTGQVTSALVSDDSYVWRPGSDDSASYTTNLMNQITTAVAYGQNHTLGYDARGSLKTDAVWTFTYDAEARLTQT